MGHIHRTEEVRSELRFIALFSTQNQTLSRQIERGRNIARYVVSNEDLNLKQSLSHPTSSLNPNFPAPALFTKTSTCPHAPTASAAFCLRVGKLSVTSNWRARHASGYLCTRSATRDSERAVATTLSPRANAAIAISRPRPLDVPTYMLGQRLRT